MAKEADYTRTPPGQFPTHVKDHGVSGALFELQANSFGDILKTIPQPDSSSIGSYYPKDNYISHEDKRQSLVEHVYGFVKRIMLSRKRSWIRQYIPNKELLLDYGCGTGELARYLNDQGWPTHGFEPNEDARVKALKKGVPVFETVDEMDGHYKGIMLWHVLEHVYHPEETLKWIHDHLETEGVVFIAVPNWKSFDASYYQSFWAAYDVPRHLWHFSPEGMRRILREHGFKLETIKPLWFDAFYVSLLSEEFKTGSKRILHALKTGFRSNRLARRTGNYSSLLYIAKKAK
ncbi:class I SAM-dependent methyltransferase [Croceiramulus getboli]|nr:class I SAM-dependent methyltransferase [Flavobacteriaceae bacterium YJPT1-3]